MEVQLEDIGGVNVFSWLSAKGHSYEVIAHAQYTT